MNVVDPTESRDVSLVVISDAGMRFYLSCNYRQEAAAFSPGLRAHVRLTRACWRAPGNVPLAAEMCLPPEDILCRLLRQAPCFASSGRDRRGFFPLYATPMPHGVVEIVRILELFADFRSPGYTFKLDEVRWSCSESSRSVVLFSPSPASLFLIFVMGLAIVDPL